MAATGSAVMQFVTKNILIKTFQLSPETGLRIDQYHGGQVSKTYLLADENDLSFRDTATDRRFAGIGFDEEAGEGYLEAGRLRHPDAPSGTCFRMGSGSINFWNAGANQPVTLDAYVLSTLVNGAEVSGQSAAYAGALGNMAAYYSRAWLMLESMRDAAVPGGKLLLGSFTQSNGEDAPMGRFTGTLMPQKTGAYSLGSGDQELRWDYIFLNHSPSVSSDERVKREIRDLGGALELILALRPIEYSLMDEPGGAPPHMGFGANQALEALTAAGMGRRALVDETNPGRLALAYEELIAPLVGAAQRQQKRIDDLEKRLEELEAKDHA